MDKERHDLDYLKHKTVLDFLKANGLSLDEGILLMKQEIEQIEEKNLEREK